MDHRATKLEEDAKAMPPPPTPRPVLLEPEIESLQRCLQNAMVKTGQVYAFYGDSCRLGISKYASNPPQALTSSLGRELEKCDQLCDAIESHLLRAIAVLQRDLQREERKQETFRLEKEARKKNELMQEIQSSDDFQFAEPAPPTSAEFLPTNPRNSPTHPGAGSMTARRPSAISISSLQRPTVPPKLDLSSSSMRLAAEEGSGIYSSGLASPVTLAPKSARPVGPNEFPEQFIAAFTTPLDQPVMGLTLPENNNRHQIKHNIDPTAGDSSDKPIDLDLDIPEMDMSMNDLFDDHTQSSTGVGNMFGMAAASSSSNEKATKETAFIDLDAQDIFANFSSNSLVTVPNAKGPDPSAPVEAPSPATLLAAGFSQHLNAPNPLENNVGLSGSEQPFDMTSLGDLGDLGAFNSNPDFALSDMDTFLSMGATTAGSGNSGSPGKATASMEQPPAS